MGAPEALPQTVPGIAVATPEALRALPDQMAREIAWYGDKPRYATADDVEADVASRNGRLVRVVPDTNIALIGRLCNPEYHREYPPYLLTVAAQAMRVFGIKWRAELVERGITRNEVRLSATSLLRTEEKQGRLFDDPTKLASAPDISTHPTGGAIDLDAAGYYIVSYGQGLVPVPHPDRPQAAVKAITEVLQEGTSKPYATPKPRPDQLGAIYDPEVTDALVAVADRLHEKGLINRIVEFPDGPNRCVHIAPDPDAPWTSPNLARV